MRMIDADNVLKALGMFNDREHGGPHFLNGIETAREIVEQSPTVDAEPVRYGRWIKMTGMLPPEYHGHYECSECQWHMKGIRNSWTREEEMTYCPSCGSKMDGDENVVV